MPKSSTPRLTPSSRRADSSARVSGEDSIRTVSVISRASMSAVAPEDSRALVTASAMRMWQSWRDERFTATRAGALSPSCLRHSTAWRQAASSTPMPMVAMSPDSSATAMKSVGPSTDPDGVSILSRASAPLTVPVCRSTVGW